MNISPVEFASLLCSRLCHDLLSPIGALNNGLELLADERDPAMRERCMELLADKRLELDWLVEEATLPKPAAKVLLNLAMIAGEAPVRGGRLDIGAERNDAGALEIVLRAAGAKLVLDAQVREALTVGGDVTARTAAAQLVHELVSGAGGAVQVDGPDAGVLLFGATFPAGAGG